MGDKPTADLVFDADLWRTHLQAMLGGMLPTGVTFGKVAEDAPDGSFFAFMVDDLAKAQSDPDTMSNYLWRIDVALRRAIEDAKAKAGDAGLVCEIRNMELYDMVHPETKRPVDGYAVKGLFVYERAVHAAVPA